MTAIKSTTANLAYLTSLDPAIERRDLMEGVILPVISPVGSWRHLMGEVLGIGSQERLSVTHPVAAARKPASSLG